MKKITTSDQWRCLCERRGGGGGRTGSLPGCACSRRCSEKFAVEQLDGHDGEDEMEEHVDDQDVEDVLQRVDDAVEDGLELGHALDSFERSQHAQHPQRFDRAQVLTRRASPV